MFKFLIELISNVNYKSINFIKENNFLLIECNYYRYLKFHNNPVTITPKLQGSPCI